MQTFLEILKYTVPSIIVLIGMYLILSKFFEEERAKQNTAIRKLLIKENSKISLPLRLQAYERATLFLERINPYTLLHRVYKHGMTIKELNLAMLSVIRSEYEYNLSQQMYMSNDAWTMLVRAKEETQKIINTIAIQLPEDGDGMILSKAILEYYMEDDKQMPVQIALNFIKDDVKTLF
ncbi:MAG: hypothetical protein H6553_13535 [Chitinophagales bacterium]|nr:hypothetical protein [Chitinophagales bacterium]